MNKIFSEFTSRVVIEFMIFLLTFLANIIFSDSYLKSPLFSVPIQITPDLSSTISVTSCNPSD